MEKEITPRMDPAFKARWLAALRSGKYPQTVGVLRSYRNEFCCLGVACDLYDQNLWRRNATGFGYGIADESTELPTLVSETIGVEPTGLIADLRNRSDDTQRLATLNDDGFTFSQIADIIEYFL